MKKILILSLLFLCSFSSPKNYYATTWAGTASNAMITRQALNDAFSTDVLFAKGSVPNDGKLLTKADIEGYAYVVSISGYSSNQLVPKSAIKGQMYFIWSNGSGGSMNPFSTLAAAQAASESSLTFGSGDTAINGVPYVGKSVSSIPNGFYPTSNQKKIFTYGTGGQKIAVQVSANAIVNVYQY